MKFMENLQKEIERHRRNGVEKWCQECTSPLYRKFKHIVNGDLCKIYRKMIMTNGFDDEEEEDEDPFVVKKKESEKKCEEKPRPVLKKKIVLRPPAGVSLVKRKSSEEEEPAKKRRCYLSLHIDCVVLITRNEAVVGWKSSPIAGHHHVWCNKTPRIICSLEHGRNVFNSEQDDENGKKLSQLMNLKRLPPPLTRRLLDFDIARTAAIRKTIHSKQKIHGLIKYFGEKLGCSIKPSKSKIRCEPPLFISEGTKIGEYHVGLHNEEVYLNAENAYHYGLLRLPLRGDCDRARYFIQRGKSTLADRVSGKVEEGAFWGKKSVIDKKDEFDLAECT
ncbi:hypothetical protein KUTeg_001260 [Tegillarca granosa]|uniref:Uncharacterized protein n=1 Tax=Tegillarca granosa TaxID=220873 RepID=A0ABQ9FZI5_TEGGR|nr:hypothetical protein KUTeg_001260 [Tegillarca granosa]